MYALWPLFKRELLSQALKEYQENPNNIDINKYESKNDKDSLPEPLPLAYKEMFEAVKMGCKVHYGSLTVNRMKRLLSLGFLIQTSVKLDLLYPGKKRAYHSILLYGVENNAILFHDPAYGEALKVDAERLERATMDVGACIVYKGQSKE